MLRPGNNIVFFSNFNETTRIRPDLSVEKLFDGSLLGVGKSIHPAVIVLSSQILLGGLEDMCFYDWKRLCLIRRIEVSPKVREALAYQASPNWL